MDTNKLVIQGVPFAEMAKRWNGPNSRGHPPFAEWLRANYGFSPTALQCPCRVIVGRQLGGSSEPFGGRERMLGRLVAFVPGLVVYDDIPASPSLTGIVRRTDRTRAPFEVVPFLAATRPELKYECAFGVYTSEPLLKADEAFFSRGVNEPDSSNVCVVAWKFLGPWIDHWLPL